MSEFTTDYTDKHRLFMLIINDLKTNTVLICVICGEYNF